MVHGLSQKNLQDSNYLHLIGVEVETMDWQSLSRCRSLPSELFFEKAEEDINVLNNVKMLCNNCPVQKICHKAGIDGREYGVWGGELLAKGVAVVGK